VQGHTIRAHAGAPLFEGVSGQQSLGSGVDHYRRVRTYLVGTFEVRRGGVSQNEEPAAVGYLMPAAWRVEVYGARRVRAFGVRLGAVDDVHRLRTRVIMKAHFAVGHRVPQKRDVLRFWSTRQNELVQIGPEVEPAVLFGIL